MTIGPLVLEEVFFSYKIAVRLESGSRKFKYSKLRLFWDAL